MHCIVLLRKNTPKLYNSLLLGGIKDGFLATLGGKAGT